MIASMTGYGKHELQKDAIKASVEIRALNSKSLDLHIKLPSELKGAELPLRKLFSKLFHRGKAEVYVRVENQAEDQVPAQVNSAAVRSYLQQLRSVEPHDDQLDTVHLLKIAMQLPDAVTTQEPDADDAVLKLVEQVAEKAAEKVNRFRESEGKSIENDFNLRVDTIESLLTDVAKADGGRIEAKKNRLKENLEKLHQEVDEQRFEQELIYYLEKLDITEEKVRLQNHLDYFRETMQTDPPNGKKLNFISQEMGREINTIGSKANDADIQRLVVRMKDELEKIKEQILNVL